MNIRHDLRQGNRNRHLRGGLELCDSMTLSPIIAHRLHSPDEQPANIRAYFNRLIERGVPKEPFATKMLKEVLSIL